MRIPNALTLPLAAALILSAWGKQPAPTLANAGYADEAGEFVVTNEQVYAKLSDGLTKDVKVKPGAGGWGLMPLGAPGDLKLPQEFVIKPVFRAKPVRKPGLVLFDKDVETTVIAPKGCEKFVLRLADEVAYHLSKMSGREVRVLRARPKDGKGPFVEFGPFPQGTRARALVSCEGQTVRLGGVDAGVSHAVTYFLEALGCRYLWPGPTGKVIPKREKVVLPELSLDWTTPFLVRKMRTSPVSDILDRPGNRGFWQWHGLNDSKRMRTCEGEKDGLGFAWGHYYGDYWEKYHVNHPEWFALQPYGTRELRLGGHPERPTFCLSNPELARETARRKIAESRAKPEARGLSICLPDGAAVSWCLCEACRKLDPVNAPVQNTTLFWPKRRAEPYVSYTDRVLTFMNRVCEEFVKECPDKYLTMYAYAGYTQPPVKVKPHPNLVILSVAGSYSASKGGQAAQANLAAWSSFGNRLLWRPNMNRGFQVPVPQNYGRHVFGDLSAMAVNGVIGCDFDTMNDEWAVKGIGYYFTARAFLNPDGLDYQTWLKDYCASGFGPAARPVCQYFLALEKMMDAAAELNAVDKTPAINWEQRVKRNARIYETIDLDALDGLLAQARTAAAGDGEVLARLARLQFGNDLARLGAKNRNLKNVAVRAQMDALAESYLKKDPAAMPDSKNKRD